MDSEPTSRTPLAGGFLIALFVILGVVAGVLLGQPSIGFVAGAGAGIVLTILLWLWDRRRDK
jgi:hypothetical protein